MLPYIGDCNIVPDGEQGSAVAWIFNVHAVTSCVHENWYLHLDILSAALQANVPGVVHCEGAAQVKEVVQTVVQTARSDWITMKQTAGIAFVFHYYSLASGKVDCWSIQDVAFLRFQMDEQSALMEPMHPNNHQPFLRCEDDDSLLMQEWSAIVMVRDSPEKLSGPSAKNDNESNMQSSSIILFHYLLK